MLDAQDLNTGAVVNELNNLANGGNNSGSGGGGSNNGGRKNFGNRNFGGNNQVSNIFSTFPSKFTWQPNQKNMKKNEQLLLKKTWTFLNINETHFQMRF